MTIKNIPFIQDIKHIAISILPKGRTEIMLYVGLLLFYLSYSLYIVFNSYIIDHKFFETDLYFSFDQSIVLKNGRTQITGHPLMYGFCYPLVLIGNAIAYILGYKAKTALFVLVSSSLISLSCVYIHRYLRKIVELKSNISLLITLFFAFFFTNLILAFTPESFTISAFLLAFTVYYYSAYIKKGESPSVFSSVLLADIFLGGITITNMAKGVIPILFLKEKFIQKVKRISIITLVFLLILVAIHLVCILFLNKNYLLSIFSHQGAWTPDVTILTNAGDYVYSRFYSIPIFFSELKFAEYESLKYGIKGFSIYEASYRFGWQYILGFIILAFILIGVIRNHKNKFVWMIVLLLGFDIFLHIVMRFGLFGPFIYGAHWIYCIPLLIGWMYKSFTNKYMTGLLFGTICIMFVALAVNNMIEILNFATLAKELFPIE